MMKFVISPEFPGGVELDMTQEEATQWQADQAEAPSQSIGDQLKSFLFSSLEANAGLIDAVTEVRIRQLQKTLETLPREMGGCALRKASALLLPILKSLTFRPCPPSRRPCWEKSTR